MIDLAGGSVRREIIGEAKAPDQKGSRWGVQGGFARQPDTGMQGTTLDSRRMIGLRQWLVLLTVRPAAGRKAGALRQAKYRLEKEGDHCKGAERRKSLFSTGFHLPPR